MSQLGEQPNKHTGNQPSEQPSEQPSKQLGQPSEEEMLSAVEAARLLGVKQQTIYAYVSRGLLTRRVGADGRRSRFVRAEVDALRQRSRRRVDDGELATTLSTRITHVSDRGLRIRGRDVVSLVEAGASFEAVADLLWTGSELPDDVAPDPVKRWEAAHEQLTAGADRWLESGLGLADRLRVAVLFLGELDQSAAAAGPIIISAMIEQLPHRSSGAEPWVSEVRGDSSVAGRLWARLTEQPPTRAKVRALDVALALLADHGLAASTFAARVAASTRADYRHVVSAGLAALGGPLHGAASLAVHRLYDRAEAASGPGPVAAVAASVEAGRRPPGFGHAVYRRQDPRYGPLIRQLILGWPEDRRLANVYLLRDLLGRETTAAPNIDLALGALTFLADMEPEAGEVIFALARAAGWLAHADEEYAERPLRLRPKARYIGSRPR